MRCVMAMFHTRRNCVVRFITVDVLVNTFAKFFVVALWNRADHYIFILWFLSSSIYLFFLSSPNLSRRRLDVCHTSTHGVALVRI